MQKIELTISNYVKYGLQAFSWPIVVFFVHNNIKSIVYAQSNSARWWHEYGLEVMESDKK